MHYTLSDIVVDIAQNGAESGASLVEVEVEQGPERFAFTVKDNGKGMTADEQERAMDPFRTDGIKHPERRVGLGLPFLVQTAAESGGGWRLDSEKGRGTEVSAWFDPGNVDCPPAGDIPGAFRTILLFPGPQEVRITRSLGERRYEVSKSELAGALGDLEEVDSLLLLDQYLRSLEEDAEC
jgi:hypothetical protein